MEWAAAGAAAAGVVAVGAAVGGPGDKRPTRVNLRPVVKNSCRASN